MRPRTLLTLPAFLGLASIACADVPGRRTLHDGDHDSCLGVTIAPAERGDFDPATGRSLLNYPPHRFADFESLTLTIDIPDMDSPSLAARADYAFTPIGNPLPMLRLDCGPASSMKFQGVSLNAPSGHTVSYKHDGESLALSFSPPLPVGAAARVSIDYTLTNPPDGLTWTPRSAAWPDRPAQLHSQGQAESNRYWFPTHDFPNERLSTELIVTVPRGNLVSSNGRLVSRGTPPAGSRLGDASRYETFHWRQGRPHVSYLVSLVVGRFDVVSLGTIRNDNGADAPVEVYAPLGLGGQVQQSYGRTPAMIDFFGRYFGQPYPWDRYAQLIVHNFSAGGMENTSATTMYDTAILDRRALLDGDLDGLISHELAHQWFGDLLTCKSWEHIWLNEGFATYCSHLWFEQRDGADAYQWGVHNNLRGLVAADKADAPRLPGMASKVYSDPWETFRRAANPYGKGAFTLHMIRQRLGDDLFRRAMSAYVAKYRDSLVESGDFCRVLENVSGRSFERFFRQWVARPGVASVEVKPRWDAASSSLIVDFTQTQTINGDNPAFDLSVPIWVKSDGGSWSKHTVAFDTRSHTAAIPLASAPRLIAVDPAMAMLADYRVDLSNEQWLGLLANGPTLASRLDAARSVAAILKADPNQPALADALAAIIADDSAFCGLRQTAAEGLSRSAPAVFAARFIDRLPADARVRASVVDGFGRITPSPETDSLRARVGAVLGRLVDNDESYGVRAESLRSLGRLKLGDASAIVVAALNQASQHDQVRQAALEALADLDTVDSLFLIIAATAEGNPSRTRALATSLVGRMYGKDPGASLKVLSNLARDPNGRVARNAGDALAEVADPGCIKALTELRDFRTTIPERRQVDAWLAHAKRVTIR